MPTFPALLRLVAGALVFALLALPAAAQDLATPKITGADLRRALIWTGHYSVMNMGDPNTLFRAAVQSWQASKKYKVTDNLADEQEIELLAEGEKQRDSFGWAKLEDNSIGFSVGVPTKLVKFLGARPNNGGLTYDFEGGVSYGIDVRYGDLNCGNVDQQLAVILRAARPTFKVKYGDGYAVGAETNWLKRLSARGVPHLRRGLCQHRHQQEQCRQARRADLGHGGQSVGQPPLQSDGDTAPQARPADADGGRPRRRLRRRPRRQPTSPPPISTPTARPPRSSARRATGPRLRPSRCSTRSRRPSTW